MRIGISTLPLYTNYGGILQGYALQTVLERMGHEVKHIRYSPPAVHYSFLAVCLQALKRLASHLIKGTDIKYYNINKDNEYWHQIGLLQSQHTRRFVETYIHSCKVENMDKVGKSGDFDALIVGSDQIWRPMYVPYPIEDAYLRFARDWKVKRIGYAISFGTDKWEYSPLQTANCKTLISKFDSVGFREASGVTLAQERLGYTGVQVLDPTFLLHKEDYVKLIKDSNTKNDGIMTYIIDSTNETNKLVTSIASCCNRNVFAVNSRVENLKAPLEERIQPPVENWLDGFNTCSMVITDSFHACVFSIMFHKPFWVLKNKVRGVARIQSLLAMFGLEDRIIETTSLSTTDYSKTIDWSMVDETLNKKRNESMDFLITSLS